MEKSKINMVCDSYVSLDEAMIQNYIANHYTFPVVNMEIIDGYYSDFLKDISELYGIVNINELIISTTNKTTFIELKNTFFIEMLFNNKGKTWNINIYTVDFSDNVKITGIIKKYEPSGIGIIIEVDNYYLDNNGVVSVRKEFKEKKDINEVSQLYYPYLNTDIMFKKYAYSTESILMLIGPTGLGKTKLVALLEKYMFEHPEFFTSAKQDDDDDDLTDAEITFRMAYVKNEEILAKDTFWEDINKTSYNIIFLDDADECLLPRDSETYTQEDANRKKFMSQLLSYTDGINSTDTKIIITTNRPANMIDKAALRKGRTFDILQLKPLTRDEAYTIWKSYDLDDEIFNNMFTGKIVPQSDIGSEIQMQLKLRELNENQFGDYLLTDDVSLIHTYRNKDNVIKL